MHTTDRRFFLKTIIAGGIALQIPFVFSCNTDSLESVSIEIDNKTYEIDLQILRIILDILFPETSFAPSATQLKSDIYYIWVLKDKRLEVRNRKFLADKFLKFQQFCKEKYGKKFSSLDYDTQTEVINLVKSTNWGESYLSRVMTIILESMFANPVYGSNPEKIGWKWIKYKGGFPEPQEWNKYPEILNLTQKNHDQ